MILLILTSRDEPFNADKSELSYKYRSFVEIELPIFRPKVILDLRRKKIILGSKCFSVR